ncbi:hypothetical protein P3T23_000051 [Paraburkholderia sp. GAS448]
MRISYNKTVIVRHIQANFGLHNIAVEDTVAG